MLQDEDHDDEQSMEDSIDFDVRVAPARLASRRAAPAAALHTSLKLKRKIEQPLAKESFSCRLPFFIGGVRG